MILIFCWEKPHCSCRWDQTCDGVGNSRARDAYADAGEIVKGLLAKQPEEYSVLNISRLLYGNQAALLDSVGEHQAVLDSQLSAQQIAKKLSALNPLDTSEMRNVIDVLRSTAGVRTRISGMEQKAVADYEECCVLADRLARDEPLVLANLDNAAKVWHGLSVPHEVAGNRDAALEAVDKALVWQASLVEKSPSDPAAQIAQGRLLGSKSLTLFNLSRGEDARVFIVQALDLLRPYGNLTSPPDLIADYLMGVYTFQMIHLDDGYDVALEDQAVAPRDAVKAHPNHSAVADRQAGDCSNGISSTAVSRGNLI